jgi:cell division inhibitor SulA/protein ImuA
MSGTASDRDEAFRELLQHPRLWRARGRSPVAQSTLPSGSAALDARLPGRGWPTRGLIELLVDRPGIGELSCLMPALAHYCRIDPEAWLAWIAPPHEPYAPALSAHGIDPERVLVVRTTQALWAVEQTLQSGACAAVLGWVDAADARSLRRIKLATEKSNALAVLFRPCRYRSQPSPAELRLVLTPCPAGLEIELFKSRGGMPGKLVLSRAIGQDR